MSTQTRTWVTDENGNRASIERWGSEADARKALESCSHCSDCSDCSGCSRCFDCSGCSDCSRCFGCSDCSRCFDCSRCSDCSGCSRCFGKFSIQDELPPIPKIERIHSRIYEAASAPNALNMGSFHSCETTHCRAGWAIHLAGQAGYDLERKTDSVFAAMQIYKASGHEISPARFFDGNDAALADMKRLAEAEGA